MVVFHIHNTLLSTNNIAKCESMCIFPSVYDKSTLMIWPVIMHTSWYLITHLNVIKSKEMLEPRVRETDLLYMCDTTGSGGWTNLH